MSPVPPVIIKTNPLPFKGRFLKYITFAISLYLIEGYLAFSRTYISSVALVSRRESSSLIILSAIASIWLWLFPWQYTTSGKPFLNVLCPSILANPKLVYGKSFNLFRTLLRGVFPLLKFSNNPFISASFTLYPPCPINALDTHYIREQDVIIFIIS